jgi:hypothetical protein
MGSSTWLDIIGSMTTFGLLLLISLRLNASSTESTSAYYANYMLQTNMLTLTLMLETDLRDIGKNYPRTVANPTPIRTATPNQFSFMIGTDQIDWVVGLPSELLSTPNPYDRYVRRNVNSVDHIMNLGVTRMTFKYWNVSSPTDSLTTPVDQTNFSLIGPVDVSIQLESPYKRAQQYMNDTTQYEMYWRQIRSVARSTLFQLQ